VALARLSPNWLLSRIAGGYVELIRNLPLLFQILFWYLAVLAALPSPRQSISLFGSFFLSNRGFGIPKPIGNPGFEPFVAAVVIAVIASLLLRRYHCALAPGDPDLRWVPTVHPRTGLPGTVRPAT